MRKDREEGSKKRRKNYASRKRVKSKLQHWQEEAWEEFCNDCIEGDKNNARDDRK